MKFIKPSRIAEANIQAEIYHRLKLAHIDCYLEYKVKKIGRLDIIILLNDEIVCIIEVKSYKIQKDFNYDSKQIARYRQLNIPILGCGNLKDIDTLIVKIKKLIADAKRTLAQ